VAGCGRDLCGAVSHGYVWCGEGFAARRGEVWFTQVWSRKAWQGRDFAAGHGEFWNGGVVSGDAGWTAAGCGRVGQGFQGTVFNRRKLWEQF